MKAQAQIDRGSLLSHSEWIRSLARALVFDAGEVDDVVQEAWVRVLQRPPRGVRDPRAWLRTIVRNAARDLARRKRARSEGEMRGSDSPEPAEDPADVHARAAQHRALVDRVLALEEPLGRTLLLRYFDDLTPKAIAAQEGAPIDTVKSRLKRGLELLRGELRREYGSDDQWALALLPLGFSASEGVGVAAGMKSAGWIAIAMLVGGGAWVVRAKPWSTEGGAEEARVDPVAEVATDPGVEGVGDASLDRPAATLGEGESQREAVQGTVEPLVRVRLLRPGALRKTVVGAEVRWMHPETRKVGRVESDSKGEIELPLPGRTLLAIDDPGGLGSVGWHPLEEGQQDVILPASGRLELHVHDGLGRSVEGVQIRLVAPRHRGFGAQGPVWDLEEAVDGGPLWAREVEGVLGQGDVATQGSIDKLELALSLRALLESTLTEGEPASEAARAAIRAWPPMPETWTTDADGGIHFEALPATEGWSFEVLSDHLLRAPDPKLVAIGGPGMGRRDAPRLNHARPFDIFADGVTRVDAELILGASVAGRLGDTAGASGILRISHLQAKSVVGTSWVAEQTLELDRTDGFLFESLQPGAKTLEGSMETPDGRIRLYGHELELGPGESAWIESLEPREGGVLCFRVVLRDRQGIELDPDEVFLDHGGGPKFQVGASGIGDFGWGASQPPDGIQASLGSTYWIEGMEGDYASLGVQEFEGGTRAGWTLAQSTPRVQPAPYGTEVPVELTLVAARTHPVELVVNGLAGEAPRRRVHLLRMDTSPKGSALSGSRTFDLGEDGRARMKLEVGQYWIYLGDPGGSELDPGRMAWTSFDVAGPGAVNIDVGEAARIEGVVLGPGGDPAPKVDVCWMVPFDLGQSHSDHLFGRTSTDDEGRFRLLGVPPHVDLRLGCGVQAQDLRSPGMGQRVEVSLRSH